MKTYPSQSKAVGASHSFHLRIFHFLYPVVFSSLSSRLKLRGFSFLLFRTSNFSFFKEKIFSWTKVFFLFSSLLCFESREVFFYFHDIRKQPFETLTKLVDNLWLWTSWDVMNSTQAWSFKVVINVGTLISCLLRCSVINFHKCFEGCRLPSPCREESLRKSMTTTP